MSLSRTFIMGALFLLAALLILGCAIYLVVCVHRFNCFKTLSESRKLLSWALAAGIVLLLGLFAFINVPTLLVILLHLVAGFLLLDGVGLLFRFFHLPLGADLKGILALVLTATYLGIGCFLAFHVFETRYALTTDKPINRDLRLVAIADAHLGVTLDGQRFARQMERVQAAEPDLVVIVGDFVDDDTKKEDMLLACRALGSLNTTYGVYFVYGNHDNGYYAYRDFSSEELRAALEENGVVVLTDETRLIDDSFYLIGRRDRSMSARMSAAALMEGVDRSKFAILLDHQPNDYAAEAAAGADLVLSGHTHGGHIFPAGPMGLWMHANDRIYGRETRGGTTFIVTSGISGWAIPIKTGTFSEYAVIDIYGK